MSDELMVAMWAAGAMVGISTAEYLGSGTTYVVAFLVWVGAMALAVTRRKLEA